MRHIKLLSIALSSLVVALGLAVTAERQAHEGPVYTVAGLAARVARQPVAWLGRAEWVRGTVRPCPKWGGPDAPPRCLGGRLTGDHTPGDSLGASLPLVERAAAWGWIRHLPMARLVVPSPQRIYPWQPATYRVLLEVAPAFACGERRCYQAVLLDAAPGVGGGSAAQYELF